MLPLEWACWKIFLLLPSLWGSLKSCYWQSLKHAGLAQWHNWHLPWCPSSPYPPCRNDSCHSTGCTGPVWQQCMWYLKSLPIFLSPLQKTHEHCTVLSGSTPRRLFANQKSEQKTGLCYLHIVLIPRMAISQEIRWFRERGYSESWETWVLCCDQTLIWCDVGHAYTVGS